jgi:hypothetical protein
MHEPPSGDEHPPDAAPESPPRWEDVQFQPPPPPGANRDPIEKVLLIIIGVIFVLPALLFGTCVLIVVAIDP